MYNLFLDDIRVPEMVTAYKNNPIDWVIVKDYNEFVEYINNNGIPALVSFDHDLGDDHYIHGFRRHDLSAYDNLKEKTGYEALKWLCEYCLDFNVRLPEIKFHTANFVGLENMQTYLGNFLKHYPGLKNK